MTVFETLVSTGFSLVDTSEGHCKTKSNENSSVFTFQQDVASPEAEAWMALL